MNISERFLETLNSFKNSTPGEDEIALLDKNQSTSVVVLIDNAKSGNITEEQLKSQLQTLINSFDDRTMSKTVSQHVLKDLITPAE
jgi:5S rRNA maturation endonuclease (ribonuclease M5)